MALFKIPNLYESLGELAGEHLPIQKYSPQQGATLESERNSYLGTPIIGSVKIEAGKFKDIGGKEISYNEVYLDAVVVVVTQTKNIVTTAVAGRSGTVKEYIADGDFQVNIAGSLINKAQYEAPETEKKLLVDACKAKTALKVVSPFLQLFGIYNLVITGYNFPIRQGFINQQPFDLTCLSDEPFELIKE